MSHDNSITVPAQLPAGPAPLPASTVNKPLTGKRRRRGAVENDSYAAFLRRAVRAHGRRIAGGDVDGLAELLALAGEVEAAIRTAVVGLRQAGYSWSEIADRLGVTRQAAHQRWGGDAG